MGWNSLHTPWVTGEVATAAELQGFTDNIVFLGSTTQNYTSPGETTASATFVNLATVGPSVTVTTGTAALVILRCFMSNDTAFFATIMGVAVSGASTVAASDEQSFSYANPATNNGLRAAGLAVITGLTPGSNTFTAKYRVTGGTGTFAERRIAVIPLP